MYSGNKVINDMPKSKQLKGGSSQSNKDQKIACAETRMIFVLHQLTERESEDTEFV